METVLDIIKNISSSDGTSLWIKAIIVGLVPLLFWIGKILIKRAKAKARVLKAEREKERDIQQNIEDNVKVEDQHEQDGGSVRDRLKRGKTDGQ